MTTINDAKAEKGFKVSGLTQKLGQLLGLIILIVIVSVLNPSFLEPLNILNLLCVRYRLIIDCIRYDVCNPDRRH